MLPIHTVQGVRDGISTGMIIDLSEYLKKTEGVSKKEFQTLETTVGGKLDIEPMHKHHIEDIKQLQSSLDSKYDKGEKYSYNVILSDTEKIPKQEIKKETRGRHKKYASDVERKEAQQKHALLHHYRKEALENYLKSNPNDEIITVKVDVSSRVLGEFNEEITYKKLPDGSYRKLHK